MKRDLYHPVRGSCANSPYDRGRSLVSQWALTPTASLPRRLLPFPATVESLIRLSPPANEALSFEGPDIATVIGLQHSTIGGAQTNEFNFQFADCEREEAHAHFLRHCMLDAECTSVCTVTGEVHGRGSAFGIRPRRNKTNAKDGKLGLFLVH